MMLKFNMEKVHKIMKYAIGRSLGLDEEDPYPMTEEEAAKYALKIAKFRNDPEVLKEDNREIILKIAGQK